MSRSSHTSSVSRQPPIRLVLFDLDETLAPDEETNASLLDELARELAISRGVAPDRFLGTVRDATRDLWETGPAAAYAQRIGISALEGLWGPFGSSTDPMLNALHMFVPEYRRRVWSRVLAACGVSDADAAERLAMRFATERAARQRPYAWSRDTLLALRDHFRLGMITNGAPDLQRQKLAGAGLAEYFDPLVVSGDLGIGKPEAEIFTHALASAGIADSSAAVMVGDSWHRDVLGAVGAGLRAIWIDPTAALLPVLNAIAQGIPSIADVRMLPSLLTALSQSS